MSQRAKMCGKVKCRSYQMPVREFCRLTGEELDHSFHIKLGLVAGKLYREIYGKDPPKRRFSMAYRNKICSYPCGILEQAYRQLRSDNASHTNATDVTAHQLMSDGHSRRAQTA
jgi:hypothetical protein